MLLKRWRLGLVWFSSGEILKPRESVERKGRGVDAGTTAVVASAQRQNPTAGDRGPVDQGRGAGWACSVPRGGFQHTLLGRNIIGKGVRLAMLMLKWGSRPTAPEIDSTIWARAPSESSLFAGVNLLLNARCEDVQYLHRNHAQCRLLQE
jgi:hypothetical protein